MNEIGTETARELLEDCAELTATDVSWEEHARTCPRCCAAAPVVRRLQKALETAPEATPDPQIAVRLRAVVARRRQRLWRQRWASWRPRLPGWQWALGAAVAAVAAVVVAVGGLERRPSTTAAGGGPQTAQVDSYALGARPERLPDRLPNRLPNRLADPLEDSLRYFDALQDSRRDST